eukprot:317491_1
MALSDSAVGPFEDIFQKTVPTTYITTGVTAAVYATQIVEVVLTWAIGIPALILIVKWSDVQPLKSRHLNIVVPTILIGQIFVTVNIFAEMFRYGIICLVRRVLVPSLIPFLMNSYLFRLWLLWVSHAQTRDKSDPGYSSRTITRRVFMYVYRVRAIRKWG